MKLVLIFTLFMISAAPSPASIRATEERCRQQYSGVVTPTDVEPLADRTLIWKDGNKEVLVCFLDGRAQFIIYMRTDGAEFSKSDIQQIMDENSDGQEWIELHDMPNPGWIRADHTVILTKHPKLNGYTVATSRWLELQRRNAK
jgi:hypothetical protein